MVAGQSNTDLEYKNPHWVVLGGPKKKTGVFKNQRPKNTALGFYKKLLPIVVICKTEEEAHQVNELNTLVFKRIADESHSTLEWAFKNIQGIDDLLPDASRFHAIRYGYETGIWVDWDWKRLSKYVDGFKQTHKCEPRWKGYDKLTDALLFMIDKEPDAEQGDGAGPQKISPGIEDSPPPPPPVAPPVDSVHAAPPVARPVDSVHAAPTRRQGNAPLPAVSESVSAAHRHGTVAAGAASSSARPVTSALLDPPVTLSASTPSARRDANVEPGRRSPVKMASGSASAASIHSPRISSPWVGVRDVDAPPGSSAEQFVRTMLASLPEDTERLRDLIRPVACQNPSSKMYGPIVFGREADKYLAAFELTDAFTQLTVLQAHLYSPNLRAFANALEIELGMDYDTAADLWDLIKLPSFM